LTAAKGRKMELRPIRTEAEYEMALSEVSAYFSEELDPVSADAECFDRLCQMIQAYEATH
jgi:HTH-type transcriptional regulator/antitoxin HigA